MPKLKLAKKKKEVADEVQEVKTKPKRNLSEVIDRDRPFTMMYSGVEDETNFNLLYDMGIRDFLISYQYVQKRHLNVDKYEELGVKFFVDSGAYTYMSDEKYKEFTIEEWEKQIVRYLNWARKHRSIIFAIASLDIERLVGGEQVQKWNEKYFEPFMLETNIPVCFVWHEDCTLLSWDQHCKRYPYVGISWATGDSELKLAIESLKIAEKYGTVVHGMAMTKTAMLTKLPFYTVDSTTWLVGVQYGEVNYWTGTKMTRLKKDKWKVSKLDTICQMGFNKEKLLDEDSSEMIRVNVHAFMEAQKYVREKLKSRMYWLRPDSVIRNDSDIFNIQYPPAEWLDDKEAQDRDWEKYAKLFNISTEDIERGITCIIDLTCFMNWYEDSYQDFIQEVYKPEVIKDLHDTWVNRIVGSEEERVEDLIEFFTSVLKGENDTLLVLGTNFDRTIREREEYLSDDEYEVVDVNNMDMMNKLSKYLPKKEDGSAPEIEELEDEIFREEGIIPVRDDKGKFIKGQKTVKKPKKMYSSKFPKMACDTCFVAQKCPHYKAGCACAYNDIFNKYDTRDMGDIIQAMQGIAEYSLSRTQRAMMFEVMEGGLPDPALSGLMDQTMRYMQQIKAMYDTGNQEVLRQTKIIRSDGTEETTTQLTNPRSGGILEKIFGNMGAESKPENEEDIIDMEDE